MQIRASDFLKRDDLEAFVRDKIGLTPENKPEEYKILGTEQELKRLNLSSKTTFWGISCICTGEEVKEKQDNPPFRGEINKNFGINKK